MLGISASTSSSARFVSVLHPPSSEALLLVVVMVAVMVAVTHFLMLPKSCSEMVLSTAAVFFPSNLYCCVASLLGLRPDFVFFLSLVEGLVRVWVMLLQQLLVLVLVVRSGSMLVLVLVLVLQSRCSSPLVFSPAGSVLRQLRC